MNLLAHWTLFEMPQGLLLFAAGIIAGVVVTMVLNRFRAR